MLRNIRLLHIHNFLTDFLPQWPYLVIYFQVITGSYVAAMSVLVVETLTSALMDIPTGIFSDRLGRRFTIALGSLCYALDMSFYAMAHGLPMLYAGAFFGGLGQCLFSGNNNALIYESLKAVGREKEFHHYRGSTGSMFQLALALSAFTAMFLDRYGLHVIFIAGIIPQVLAIFVSLLFEEPRVHIATPQTNLEVFGKAFAAIRRNPRLLLLVLGKAICYGAGESTFKFKVAFVNLLWPSWAVGLYRGINHILGFLGFQMAGYVVERVKAAYIFVFRDAFWFVTQMIAVIMVNVFSPILLLLGSVVFGPGEVASDHLMQIEFTDEQRATMGSLASFAGSVVFAIAALGIGAVSDGFGVAAGAGLGVCLSVLSLPVYAWLFRKDF